MQTNCAGEQVLILFHAFHCVYNTNYYFYFSIQIHDIHQLHTSTICDMIDGQEWIPSQEKIIMKKHVNSLIKPYRCIINVNLKIVNI